MIAEASWDDDESTIRENGFSLDEVLWFRRGERVNELALFVSETLGARSGTFTLSALIEANVRRPLEPHVIRGIRQLGVGERFVVRGPVGARTVVLRVK